MIRKLIRQMLAAQTLAALAVSVCLLIDNIMIGQFLGEEGLAAYSLANPVLLFIGAVGSMLTAGAQVACSRSLGSGSREETDRGYSSAIVLGLGFSLVFMMIVLVFRNMLATAMGAGSEGSLYDQTRNYMAGFVIGAPAMMGALVLVPFLQMAGQSALLIGSVLGMAAVDVGLDLANALVFKGGMFGMGLASALSYYTTLVIAMAGYFLRKKCVFRFSPKLISGKKIRELAVGGVPSIFGMASSVVLVFVLNHILMGVGGSAAVAAYSASMTIGNSANCVSTGVGGVSLTLSGILYNEEDRTGLKEMLRLLAVYGVFLGIGMGVILLLFAPALVSIFIPTAGSAQTMAVLGTRLFAAGLIPCCMNNVLKSMYQGTERVKITETMSVLEGAVLPAAAAFILSRFMNETGVWLNFFAGETLALLGISLYVWKKSGRVGVTTDNYLMLKDGFGVKPEDLLEMDIHSMEDVIAASEKAERFCLDHGQGPKTANHIALCIEEMASNTVKHGSFGGKGKNHLSVRVQHKAERWTLRFRDDCGEFDPVRYVPREGKDALGIRLVMAMADDVRYTYSMNMNNLTIKLHAREE